MKISKLIEMLNNCKDYIGDVEVNFCDYHINKEYKINGIDTEENYINITGE